MNEQHAALEMRRISKIFPGVVALDEVDFAVQPSEVHILLGENGAGKSTLMKILSGAYQKSSGRIFIRGREVDIRSPKQAQELGISIIYQELNLIPNLTIAENVFLGREPILFPGVIDHKKIYADTQRLLDRLAVTLTPKSRVQDLSVAQQQMVEVAKALSLDAQILIMDEPSSALSEHEISQLFTTIRTLKESGVSMIYISHRLEELFEIGDRVTVLRDGRYVGTRDVKEVTTDDLVRMMVDRTLTEQFPKQRAEIGGEVLRIENLCVDGVLKNIRFSLHHGEVLGIAGLMGSGRTELARTLFGLNRISAGQIFIRNEACRIRSPRQAINHEIGFLTEDRKTEGLVLLLSVKENIVLPSLDRFARFGCVNAKEEDSTASRFVRDLRVRTPGLQQKALFLSGGNQQKVVLSKWLCSEADILIFDEPTRGIDIAAKVEIYQLMNRLTAQGVAILMISSELPEILGMSDRILVMHQGTISGEFPRDKATQERILQCALGERNVN